MIHNVANPEFLKKSLGVYSAPNYQFSVGSVAIQFEPKGTYIIGADGRVDVTASTGERASLILSKNNWRYLNPETKDLLSLNEESLLTMLQYLLEK